MSKIKIPEIDYNKLRLKIESFIKDIISDSNSNGVVIGLSGGIDSACVAYLAVSALGSENVMAICFNSSTAPKEDLNHARAIAEKLSIEYKEIDIDKIVESILNEIESKSEDNSLNEGNLKARIRMSILYYYSNLNNRLTIGTTNKSELLYGYFTKFGDGASDLLPIANLYKTQVYKLSKDLKISKDILYKPPRAGLKVGQTDEDEIGMNYDKLDLILYMIYDLNLTNVEILNNIESSEEEINRIRNKIKSSKHKNELAPKAEI